MFKISESASINNDLARIDALMRVLSDKRREVIAAHWSSRITTQRNPLIATRRHHFLLAHKGLVLKHKSVSRRSEGQVKLLLLEVEALDRFYDGLIVLYKIHERVRQSAIKRARAAAMGEGVHI